MRITLSTHTVLAALAVSVIVANVGAAAFVHAWTGPTATPPNGNVAPPINVGTASQIKNGAIGVNGLSVFGNTILLANSYVNWGTVAGAGGYGLRDNNGAVEYKNSGNGSLWQRLNYWTHSGDNLYTNAGTKVGINTAAPSAALHVQATGGNTVEALLQNSTTPVTLAFSSQVGTPTTANGSAGIQMLTYGDGSSDIGFVLAPGGGRQQRTAMFMDGSTGNFVLGDYHPDNKVSDDGDGPSLVFGAKGGSNTDIIEIHRDNWADNKSSLNLTVGDDATSPDAYDSFVIAATDYNTGKWYDRYVFDLNGNLWADANIHAWAFMNDSDARLKENIVTSPGLSVIDRLRGVTFNWKLVDVPTVNGRAASGVIAQEVETVMPSAVTTKQDGYKQVEYNQLIAPMIESIKELHQKVQSLEQTVQDQQAQIRQLQREVATQQSADVR